MSQQTLIKGLASGNITVPFSCSSTGEMNIATSSALDVNPITGASTSALQTTGNSSLSSIDSTLSAFTCDTSSVTVSSSVLPTNASTSALQSTGNSSLSSIDTKTPSLGQAVKSSSVPVTLASDQGALSVEGSSTSTSQTLAVAATTKTESTTLDTDGFKRIGYIVYTTGTGSFAQLEWSHDSSNWYHVESRSALASVSDAQGSSAQVVHYFTVDCLAKYVRVGVYNSTASPLTHEIIANRIA